jgi:hypothetical protein
MHIADLPKPSTNEINFGVKQASVTARSAQASEGKQDE